MPGMKTLVFSRTLRQEDHPEVAVVNEHETETVAVLKANSGKDIWLFGGGLLFRSLAANGLVDTVEVGIVPILLGEGIPLLPTPANRSSSPHSSQSYSTGVARLEYAIT